MVEVVRRFAASGCSCRHAPWPGDDSRAQCPHPPVGWLTPTSALDLGYHQPLSIDDSTSFDPASGLPAVTTALLSETAM